MIMFKGFISMSFIHYLRDKSIQKISVADCTIRMYAKQRIVLYLSLVTRKPVFRVCDQVRLKPVCSATETS